MIRATYRVQLRNGTDFPRVRSLVPYFARLGVSHLYLSPIFCARRGSSHGYDVVDPRSIDPVLGTEEDFRALVGDLRSCDMGVVLDIVPNHLATGSANRYWEDVLRWGRRSSYAEWFDIHWERGKRVFLPLLGDWLPRVLQRGELMLAFREGRFRVTYFDESFPVSPPSMVPLLDEAVGHLRELGDGRDVPDQLRAIRDRLADTAAGSDRDPAAADAVLDELQRLAVDDSSVHAALADTSAAYGGGGGQRLHRLLAAQPYRLAYWRRAAREINYRRFFTVSHLVAVRQEREDVFEATHRLVLHLAAQGLIDGVRVDHVDGLLDPAGYLDRLRAALAQATGGTREVAIWVEKILARGERLPAPWPVRGTTGYEFLSGADALSLDADGWRRVEQEYRALARSRPADFSATARQAKRTILTNHVTADVARLARQAHRLAGNTAVHLSVAQIGKTLVEIVAALDCYRVYALDAPPWYERSGREALERAFRTVEHEGRVAPSALPLLAQLLLLDPEPATSARVDRGRVDFARRVGQLAVTAAAKGVEDTALYRYAPLAVLNEVGSEPTGTALQGAVDDFHAANVERHRRSPTGLLSTSTHDTKWSADVRSRLAVLSEIPDEWLGRVRRWQKLNASHRSTLQGRRVPDAHIEYLFYQTAVGIWPLGDRRDPDLRGRIERYVLKAAREAKVSTSWARPNEPYEEALRTFLRRTLRPAEPFVDDLTGFVRHIGHAGLCNALGRTLLHLTAPGVPDVYQGDELWTFRLVDPDNRAPVDFARRSAVLDGLDERMGAGRDEQRALLGTLLATPDDGSVKMHVIRHVLALRREHGALFADGGYDPVVAVGPAASHVVSFARHLPGVWSMTVVPRLVFTLTGRHSIPPMGEEVWRDTSLRVPDGAAGRPWRSVLTDDIVGEPEGHGGTLRMADVLRSFPVALLVSMT